MSLGPLAHNESWAVVVVKELCKLLRSYARQPLMEALGVCAGSPLERWITHVMPPL
jgi:hypothetical protein